MCEQIYAWFRNFSLIVNEMRANQNLFFPLGLVLEPQQVDRRLASNSSNGSFQENLAPVSYSCAVQTSKQEFKGKTSNAKQMVMQKPLKKKK